MVFPVAAFKSSYLSSLARYSIWLGFCGLQHVSQVPGAFTEAAWSFEMVCREGMHLAEEVLVFDVSYSQPCIFKDSILSGAKQNFALIVFVTLNRFLVWLVAFWVAQENQVVPSVEVEFLLYLSFGGVLLDFSVVSLDLKSQVLF